MNRARPPSSRRRTGSLALAVGWSVTAATGCLALTQLVNRGSHLPLVYVGQSLSPYVFAATTLVALSAFAARRLTLGIAGAIVSLPLLVLSGPIVRPGGLPEPAADAPRLTVLSANVLWRNPTREEAAATILGADADVIVISEFTTEFDAALVDGGVNELYPYRAGTPDTWLRGTAMWSRYPIVQSGILDIFGRTTIDATIDVDGTPMRLIAAHPSQPISAEGRNTWRRSLNQLTTAALRPGAPPTVLIGDMNASWWHPPFRGMVERGLVDVHSALGKGASRSWPADQTFVPPFVRIDHALVAPGMTAVAIRDIRVPGSDHVAFEVTVAPAAHEADR